MRNKAVYLALGILPDASKDILGLWIESTEGANFWMKVFNVELIADHQLRTTLFRGKINSAPARTCPAAAVVRASRG